MDVVVTGIGLVSSLGTLESTWSQLLAGQSGIRRCQPFPDLPAYPLGLIGSTPADLEDLTRQVVTAAIADAGLSPPLPDCAVVIGSSRGQQRRWEAIARAFPHAALSSDTWLGSLPHAAAATAAHLLGTQAAVRSPMAACATGLWAIAQAYDLVQSGEYRQVLAGAVEAPITPLTLTGFQQMGALATTGAYPFDRDREGLVLGEGGAVLLLETADSAQQRGARIYGQIRGAGLSADAHHVSAPNPNRRAAIAAVRQCLTRSHLTPAAIDFIHAHGTATRLNDQQEADLIQAIFPAQVPVSSTKGATGHTIGASGALGVAISLFALHHQRLPPTVGLTHPAVPLNFVRATRPIARSPLHTALCLGFGFGGQNAAIALATAPFS